ncbi:MAG: hypothetical protein GY841_03575 [FCB group bacterium]|nr:hypothetical protein [FCB group bacterium]
MERTEIAVGDSVKLEIYFSTSTYRGTIVKRPKICVDRDSLCRYIELRTNVVAKPDSTYPLVISPYRLMLMKTDSVDITYIEFHISNRSDTSIFIRPIDYPKDYFELLLPPETVPDSSISGHLTLNGLGLQNSFNKSLTFECDDAVQSRFTIPIVRQILGQGEVNAAINLDPECPE